MRLRNNRLIPMAIEPRAALADFDELSGSLTLKMTTQNPHLHRLLMSLASLGLPEHKMRVIAPEVGGGFGSKIHHYPDEAITSFCAMQLHRPVKWTASRSEGNQTDAHGRDHVTKAELALDADGRILGLRATTYAAMGAYLSTFAPVVPTYLHGTLLSGQYDIPAIYTHVTATFTNTAPVDALRGAGRPEATYIVERLMDLGAAAAGLDPAELRRRNFVPRRRLPLPDPGGAGLRQRQLRAGAGPRAGDGGLRRAARRAGAAAGERRGQAPRHRPVELHRGLRHRPVAGGGRAGRPGRPVGERQGARAPHRHGHRLHRHLGARPGARHHLRADRRRRGWGCDMEKIDVVHGDTGEVPFGMGTYGSRSAAVGGSAIAVAVDKAIEKGKKIAAHLLEAAEEDLEFADGKYAVKGVPDKVKTWGDVALQAYLAHNLPDGMEPGLEETAFYNPANFVYPFGTHVAVVEIDRDTGEVELTRYVAVDDCGNRINPMIVDGQIHGGIAHGVGQALWEEAVYDEQGQLVTATLLDYAVPKAHRLPSFELDSTVTPCPHNPLGVKGIGEAGTIASPAAVANAVIDALAPFGVRHLDMPLTRGEGLAGDAPGREGLMFPASFDYHRAASVGEALDLLAAHPDAKAIAGGHSLLPLMKLRLAQPPALVDIGRLGELSGIRAHRRRHDARRRPDPPRRDRRLRGAGPGLPAPRRGGGQDRRPAGAQPRHHRRQHRPRRPGLRPAGGAGGPGRHRPPALGRRRAGGGGEGLLRRPAVHRPAAGGADHRRRGAARWPPAPARPT